MKKQELRTSLSQLTAENRRVLHRMARYLDSYSLNEVAYEELMADLFGMALECQERGQEFAQAVGMDERLFCHELVANCPRETRTERVLGFLRWMVAWLAVILPVMLLLEWIFPWMPGTVEGLVYHVPAPFFSKYCAAVVAVAGFLYFFKRMAYYARSAVWSVFAVAFLMAFITVSEVSGRLVREIQVPLSPVVWLLSFGALFLLCDVGKRSVAMTVAYQQKKRQLREQKREVE